MANENVTATNALVGLQGQLDTVRSEVLSTNIGLQNISTLIQRDNILDQQRLLEEREQERLLAEREVRIGQQQEIQQKIAATLVKPVTKLEGKLTNTFDKITSALKYLFTGFLGVQVLRGLKFSADLGIKTLSGIGSFLRNAFGLITSGLSALSGGFGSVIRSIFGVTTKVSNAILSLAKSPFKTFADIFKKFLPNKPSTPSSAAPSASTTSIAGRGLGLLVSAGGILSTAQNIGEGDVPGAILSGASIFRTPFQLPAAIGSFAYETLTGGGMDVKKLFSGSPNISNIQIPKLNFNYFGDMGKNVLKFFGFGEPSRVTGSVESGNSTETSNQANINLLHTMSESTTSATIVDFSNKPEVNTIASNLQSVPFQPLLPPSQRNNISDLSEATPDLVYLQSGQEQAQPSSTVSGQSRTLTDVPLIPSSNPDNFYTLYAQVNYNVVI